MSTLTIGTQTSSTSPSIGSVATAKYNGQVINQFLTLAAAQVYASKAAYSAITITPSAPVRFKSYDSNGVTIVDQVVSQQLIIDSPASTWDLTNEGTTALSLQVSLAVLDNPSTGVQFVFSVNSVVPDTNGNVLLTAADISDIPGQYVLPIATATRLGGVRAGAGIAIDTDGTIHLDTTGRVIEQAVAQVGMSVTTSPALSAAVIDFSQSNSWTVRVGGSTVISFINPPAGADQTVRLHVSGGSGFVVQWPDSAEYVAGAKPVLSSSHDIFDVIYNGTLGTYSVVTVAQSLQPAVA